MSRTEINFNEAESILECSAHIFIDDLELALKSYSNQALNIGTEKEDILADSLIRAYLRDHFSLTIDDKAIPITWLGKEMTEDLSAIWIYFYYHWNGIGRLKCLNDILMETYEDQKNMIEYREFGKPKTILLTSNRRSAILN